MSGYSLRWTKRAVRRLDEIGANISANNPSAAARVTARLISATNLLANHPAMGRTGRIDGTRELVLADIPYIIPYRVIGDRIDILTIMHTSQKWSLG